MQGYPHNDLEVDTVLLYRHSPVDRFTCQVAGCGKTFLERSAARRHGRSHFEALGLDPLTAKVSTHTGPRPVTPEKYQDYRRRYKRDWKRGRDEDKRAQRPRVEGESCRQMMSRQGAVGRIFPVALARLEKGEEGVVAGCEFQVICQVTRGGSGRLTVTGSVEGDAIIASVRCAIAWGRLHWKEIGRLVAAGGGSGDSRSCLDLSRGDVDYFVDFGKDDLKKHGSSVGLAVASAIVRVITGVGVEPCVAMTGEVGLSGAVSGVSGLEEKLRYAHSSTRIKVVVLPRENLADARALVRKYGLSSVRLLPVCHMGEVIRLLFIGSVDTLEGAATSQELDGEPMQAGAGMGGILRGDKLTEARSWVLLDDGEVAFPIVECALLPGSGQRWCSGVFFAVGGAQEARQQVDRSICCVQEMLSGRGLGKPPGRLSVYDLFDAKWDIFLHVRGQSGKTRSIGLAVVCALLALALGRQIEPSVAFSGGVTLQGQVLSDGLIEGEDVKSLVLHSSRVLLNPRSAGSVTSIKTQLLAQQYEEDIEGQRRLQALEVVEVDNVLTMARALCATLWPTFR